MEIRVWSTDAHDETLILRNVIAIHYIQKTLIKKKFSACGLGTISCEKLKSGRCKTKE